MEPKKVENRFSFILGILMLGCAALCYFFIFRKTPHAVSEPAKAATAVFDPNIHLKEVRADSFDTAISRAYKNEIQKHREHDKWYYTIARNANTAHVYNSNPELLKVKSDYFSASLNRSGDELQLFFKVYTKSNVSYMKVPTDILLGMALEF